MIDPSKVGTDWQAAELDAIVATYFAMLAAELTGRPYVKAHHARGLMARTGRSHRSVEFKHMNLSSVLADLGLPTIRGYKRKDNIQGAIFPAVERYLDAHPEAWGIGLSLSSPFHGEGDREAVEGATRRWPSTNEPDQSSFASPWSGQDAPPSAILPITAPPPLGPARKPRPEGLARIVRKYDPAARDHRNRALGQWGEEHVLRHERAFLIAHDRPDLARKIEWTSQERGDGAGYDIRSFDPAGRERLIEVKATRGGPATDFFLTRTEREVSAERPDAWRLYRLHDLAAAPALFQLKPPLEAAVTLTAETWRAGF
ncbi:hypothetical protein HNP32_000309 [Brevundimonas bullata]|uniref:Protein NO VEIN C-terminal domain-containing protein n=1 Tax=Brevundimonas bullata TaxID=13160 RepID=A0A7W7N1T5_9CAUL|nr:DUF3883 domain-containing protein [Brevundimonas bullata]MBB4796595.1 hypothetical protein [Brevundimonas bullata]MBB6381555.1 hypothetical protein [Brevundimonas bullata]